MVARESNMQKKIFFLGKWMDLSVATPRSTLVWLSCYSGAHGLDFIFGGISAVTRYATCSPISLPPTGPGPFVCSFCIVFVFDRLNRMCKNSRSSWSNTANAKSQISMTCTLQSKTSVDSCAQIQTQPFVQCHLWFHAHTTVARIFTHCLRQVKGLRVGSQGFQEHMILTALLKFPGT